MSPTITDITLPTASNGTSHGVLDEVRNIKMSPAVLGGIIASIVSLMILVTLLWCLRARREKHRLKRRV
jgi:hypothetical protein